MGNGPSVIKSVTSFIFHPLAHIFNLSFLAGFVPPKLKVAKMLKLLPVFKSSDRQVIHNYRPISVLRCFSKISERLVYNYLTKFISKFNIILINSLVFVVSTLADMAFIHVTDLISNSLSDRLCTAGVFIHLSKAFDMIDFIICLWC